MSPEATAAPSARWSDQKPIAKYSPFFSLLLGQGISKPAQKRSLCSTEMPQCFEPTQDTELRFARTLSTLFYYYFLNFLIETALGRRERKHLQLALFKRGDGQGFTQLHEFSSRLEGKENGTALCKAIIYTGKTSGAAPEATFLFTLVVQPPLCTGLLQLTRF